MNTPTLDRILHQPVRTQIMAYLVAHGPSEYSMLKKELTLSDGHMTTHMRALLGQNYIKAEKAFVDNKPCTTYSLTPQGRRAFTDYIKALKEIIMI